MSGKTLGFDARFHICLKSSTKPSSAAASDRMERNENPTAVTKWNCGIVISILDFRFWILDFPHR